MLGQSEIALQIAIKDFDMQLSKAKKLLHRVKLADVTNGIVVLPYEYGAIKINICI